ncbi:hypothetical protein ACQCSX_07755 [Pseudarthrobacter sp. P1]|uniref:hypothetical protein n=1 Tax=Pseudarthrobacter sp. P1 TaxID=3418418 RepID=UPI003CF7979C
MAQRALILGMAVAAVVALAGCDGGSAPAPSATQSTAASSPAGSTAAASTSGTAGPSSSAATSGGAPTAGPTASAWKTYTDPDRKISFELPQEWTTQRPTATAVAETTVEVKNSAGEVVATFKTSPAVLGGGCAPEDARDYTVLASVPMGIPSTSDDGGAVSPRFVYRLVQGTTAFYASYGITDHIAGAGGKACQIYNTVSDTGMGHYMFGDVQEFSGTPDGAAGLRTFDTLAQAQAYMLTSEFQNIARMITSLKVG